MSVKYNNRYEKKVQQACENLRYTGGVPYPVRIEKGINFKQIIPRVALAAILAGGVTALGKAVLDAGEYYQSIEYQEPIDIGLDYMPILNIRGDNTAFFTDEDGNVFYEANGHNANYEASRIINEMSYGNGNTK